MTTAIMWSISTGMISIVIGLLLIYVLRRRKARATRSPDNADEKCRYHDEEHNEGTTPRQTTVGSQLPSTVTSSDSESIDRAQWVLRMTRHVFKERHKSRYNVVVINQELEYHFSPEGVVEQHVVKYYEPSDSRAVPYEIVVFREGVLLNMGDGGDINWDWMGNFKRNGDSMLTFKACESGAMYLQDPWVSAESPGVTAMRN